MGVGIKNRSKLCHMIFERPFEANILQITQGFMVGRLIRRGYNEWSVITVCLLVLSFAYAALGLFVWNASTFCIAVFPLMIAGSVLSAVTLGRAINLVPYQNTGKMAEKQC